MATIAGSRLYEIFLGTPTSVSEVVTILGAGPAGDATLRRRLTHPDPSNFAPLVYFQNPDRTFNVDNEVLRAPISQLARTLSTTATIRFEEVDGDVVITEIWTADPGKFSMPGFLFRALYEYLINPPAFSATAQTYITWEPRDKNAKTYNVELFRMVVGAGGDPQQLFDVNEFFPPGQGSAQGDPLASLDDAFATEGSGLIDRTVILQFKIVNEVTA